jgi:ornithine carbamoyltransferase
MKDLLTIADLTRDDLEMLLALAAEFKADPHREPDFLAGEIVALYFSRPSTRTRFSFEAAIHRLGGSAVAVGPAELQLSRGETIEDTARTLSHFARAAVIRTSSHKELEQFAGAATMPVVNALTDSHHPCQALADFLTLRERFGTIRGLRVAYVGDGANNVARSLLEAAALAGANLAIGAPAWHQPALAALHRIGVTARANGGSVFVTEDPALAVRDAVAVYTDTWMSMGSDESERDARLREFAPFQVNEALLSCAAPGAAFMHCLPAHRGEEVTAQVIDGPRSMVFEQVENRGHTEQAVLVALLQHRLHGSPPC